MNPLAGRYEIIKQLGRGGFAITFLAKDHLQPSKPLCVVKQLRPNRTNPRVIDFFEKEAAILEKLGSHPQIPRLLAHFNQDENLYIVQEFIEGQDLSKEIQPGKRLSESYVAKLLQDVLEVLSFVHSQGVIHRDIKPQNLMRQRSDGKIFLIDFGAVKQVGTIAFDSPGHASSSVIIGSLGYMPAEQGIGKPCLASDVYALGMTAIHALTGIVPFELEEDPQTLEIIWRQHAQVSDRLTDILNQMIRRHHSMRYPSAKQALFALTTRPATLKVVPKQQYFQEVSLRVLQGEGKFSVVALKILELKRIELGLSEDEAREIEKQVLQPYQEYQHKLREYEQVLVDAVKQQYPLNKAIEKDLQDYRQYLGLKDGDVAAIEQRVLGQLVDFTESLGNGVVLEMVAIKGGQFLMGSPEDEEGRRDSESPQHQVSVEPFFIGKFTITQAQWKAVAALDPVKIDLNPNPSNFKGLNRPVERVSWNEAVEFCARLSRKTGKNYRLPSEAEWEYAARAGTTTPFHFGETITTDLANYDGNYTYGSAAKGVFRQQTTNVGNFPANAFGLYDMHGNVWEWCQDTWHENYDGAPTDGSAWVTGDNSDRLLRGGSWHYLPDYCRSGVRLSFTPDADCDFIGFRVVVSFAPGIY